MSQWSDDVRMVLHAVDLGDLEEATAQRLAAVGVRVHQGPIRSLQVHYDVLTGALLDDGTVVDCDAVVVLPRLIAQDALLIEVGVEVTAGELGEFVVRDENGATGTQAVTAAAPLEELDLWKAVAKRPDQPPSMDVRTSRMCSSAPRASVSALSGGVITSPAAGALMSGSPSAATARAASSPKPPVVAM